MQDFCRIDERSERGLGGVDSLMVVTVVRVGGLNTWAL